MPKTSHRRLVALLRHSRRAGGTVAATTGEGSEELRQRSVADETGPARVELATAGSWVVSVTHAGPTEDRGRVVATATLALTSGPRR